MNPHVHAPDGTPPPSAPAFPAIQGDSGRMIVSIAMAAISITAAYFCLVHGLPMLDTAVTTPQLVSAYILSYSGAAFILTATGNLVYMLCRDVIGKSERADTYTAKEMRIQVGVTLTAPISAIGALAACAICAAANR